jgi:hypothetical protein
MGYSAKIKIDTAYKRTDGTCAIFMQILIDRKKSRIQLGICWPPEKFSERDYCKPRTRKDPDADEYNIIISNALAKANTIRKDYLLRGIHLTIETFLKEFRTDLNKNDFIQYFAQKSFERWNTGKITNETYEKEKGTLRKLQKFYTVLPFHEFNIDWPEDFDRRLKRDINTNIREEVRKKEISINGRWPRHKHVKVYLNIASNKDNIKFTDPYTKFKNQLQDGSWKPLELGQFKTLLEQYIAWKDNPLPMLYKLKDMRKGLTKSEVIVLRRFLFSCNSALRISDLQELDVTMFNKGQMTIVPKKTERYGTKIESVPLNDIARMLLDDEIESSPSGRVFNRYTDQGSNKILKRIASKLNLDINLHNHVARFTFGSLMDQAGANHTALMKFMGLRKRATLEKYIKTDKKVMNKDLNKMNELLKG